MTTPAVAPAGKAREYFDGTDLRFSKNGSPWFKAESVFNVCAYRAPADTDWWPATVAAVAAATAANGGIVKFPQGSYQMTQVGAATITIAHAGVYVRGEGSQNTYINFTPATGGAVFTFSAGAAIIGHVGISGFTFGSTDLTTPKTMVKVIDASVFDIEDVISYDATGWTSSGADYAGGTTYASGAVVKYLGIRYVSLAAGNVGNTPVSSPASWNPTPTVGSIGLDVSGREFIRARNFFPFADFPVWLHVDPNIASISYDHSGIDRSGLGVNPNLAHWAITVDDGFLFSNDSFTHIATNRGNGLIGYSNTLMAGVSNNIYINDIRCEPNGFASPTAGTYCIDIVSTNGNIQGLQIENVRLGTGANGVRLGKAYQPVLKNVWSTLASGVSFNLDSSNVFPTMECCNGQAGSTVSLGVQDLILKNCKLTGYSGVAPLSLAGNSRIWVGPGTTQPTVGTLAGLGTTGTATIAAGSSDTAGVIILTPGGTGITAAGNLLLTFSGASLGANKPVVLLTLSGGGGVNWDTSAVCQTSAPGNSFSTVGILWKNGAVVPTAGSAYWISYFVIAK